MYNKSKNERPYFSILIPSYNRPDHLIKCIDSVLANDFAHYEIIISDDSSPRIDEIEEVINRYLQCLNVSFFKQAKNLKEPGNKNFLVEQAKGQYTIILGDDDKFYPYTLTRISTYIDNNPDYDLYCLGYTVIDENDKVFYSRHSPKAIEVSVRYQNLVEHLFVSDLFPFWLFHPATFCCKNGVEKEIPYSEHAGIGEDFLFLFDFINREKKMFVIPESLFCWRKIQNESTVGQKNQSLGDFSNVWARRNILYHLKQRQDLNPFISAFISNYEYRKRFLYNPILHDTATNKEMIDSLLLDQTDLKELQTSLEEANYFDVHYNHYIKRCIDFIKLFGISGLLQICVIFSQRMRYKFKTVFR